MHNIKLLFSLFLLLLVLVTVVDSKVLDKKTGVKSSTDTTIKISKLTPTPTPSSTPTETQIQDTPTPTLPPSRGGIDSFIYPGSIIEDREEDELELKSSGNIDEITNWYKDKLKSMNMSMNTSVKTSANGNIINKLVAADSNTKVSIDIRKNSKDSLVEIKIGLM